MNQLSGSPQAWCYVHDYCKVILYSFFFFCDRAELIERTMHGLSRTLKPSQEWHRRLEEHYYTVNQRLPSDQQDTSSSGVGKWTARFATWPRTEGVAGSTIPTLPPIESAEVQVRKKTVLNY